MMSNHAKFPETISVVDRILMEASNFLTAALSIGFCKCFRTALFNLVVLPYPFLTFYYCHPPPLITISRPPPLPHPHSWFLKPFLIVQSRNLFRIPPLPPSSWWIIWSLPWRKYTGGGLLGSRQHFNPKPHWLWYLTATANEGCQQSSHLTLPPMETISTLCPSA
jgi:hypothetical protein